MGGSFGTLNRNQGLKKIKVQPTVKTLYKNVRIVDGYPVDIVVLRNRTELAVQAYQPAPILTYGAATYEIVVNDLPNGIECMRTFREQKQR